MLAMEMTTTERSKFSEILGLCLKNLFSIKKQTYYCSFYKVTNKIVPMLCQLTLK